MRTCSARRRFLTNSLPNTKKPPHPRVRGPVCRGYTGGPHPSLMTRRRRRVTAAAVGAAISILLFRACILIVWAALRKKNPRRRARAGRAGILGSQHTLPGPTTISRLIRIRACPAGLLMERGAYSIVIRGQAPPSKKVPAVTGTARAVTLQSLDHDRAASISRSDQPTGQWYDPFARRCVLPAWTHSSPSSPSREEAGLDLS